LSCCRRAFDIDVEVSKHDVVVVEFVLVGVAARAEGAKKCAIYVVGVFHLPVVDFCAAAAKDLRRQGLVSYCGGRFSFGDGRVSATGFWFLAACGDSRGSGGDSHGSGSG
jgi:hypothetical protein